MYETWFTLSFLGVMLMLFFAEGLWTILSFIAVMVLFTLGILDLYGVITTSY